MKHNSNITNWRTVKLKEVCREITVGHVGPMAKEYVENGIPFLRSQNVLPFSLDTSSVKYITPAFHNKLKKSALFPGDVVVVRTGYPGTAVVIPEKLPISNCADLVIIRPSTKLDSRFLASLFNSTWGQGSVSGNLVGVAQQHFNIGAAKEMIIHIPPLPIQRKIATILYDYNDLIENNTRRIKILEEMAQALYREWFVKFRFPGHEKVRMVESELGMVPEGWEVKKLGSIADINASSLKKGHEPEEINYIDIASVSTGKIDKIEHLAFADAPSRARRIVKRGDIIWSTVRPNRKSYSVILNPPPNLVVSTGFAVITAKHVPYTYLYHALITDDFVGYLINHTTGAAYPAVNFGDFENALILVPQNSLLDSFHNIIADLFDHKQTMQQKNANLRCTRDLLLPKLISGEVDVENIEVRMPNHGQV